MVVIVAVEIASIVMSLDWHLVGVLCRFVSIHH